MNAENKYGEQNSWRYKIHEIIFEADTPAGRWFDIILILCIALSVIAVMLDSVQSISLEYGFWLTFIEWLLTILFTFEYMFRLYAVKKPISYATSFFGIVDIISILPTYISLIFPGGHFLLVIRLLRILRIFRILKLMQYVGESILLIQALHASRRKINIFIFTVITLSDTRLYYVFNRRGTKWIY